MSPPSERPPGEPGGAPMLEVVSPWTQEVVARLELDTETGLEAKLDRARRALAAWRGLALAERIGIVELGLDRLAAEREAIARELALQVGKPIAQGLREV